MIDMDWENGRATHMQVTARKGGNCKIYYKGNELPSVKDAKNRIVKVDMVKDHVFSFDTKKGKSYSIEF